MIQNTSESKDTATINRSNPTIEEKNTPVLVSVYYTGKDNGTEKCGYESLSFEGPKIKNAEELQELVDSIAVTLFKDKKWEDLKIIPISILRYPL